jgi:hypothetical protein
MRISLGYAAAAGILAASFTMLGPVAQASQIPGTSVPATSHSSAARTGVMEPTTCLYHGVEEPTGDIIDFSDGIGAYRAYMLCTSSGWVPWRLS